MSSLSLLAGRILQYASLFQEEDRKQLSQFLREALFCLSIYQSPKDSLRIAVTELW